jgi:hypothetical protein
MPVDIREALYVNRVLDVDAPFGVFVAKGSVERDGESMRPGKCKLPTLTGDQIIGVLVFEHQQASRTLSGVLALPAGSVASIMRNGVIWVVCEKAVNEGDPVFVRHAANGGNTQLGAATDTDDSTFTSLLANARFASTTTGAGLAQVELLGSINAMT